MKHTLLLIAFILFGTITFAQSFNRENITYSIGIIRMPLESEDFNDFHISDWQDFGLGSIEGRVAVPLSEERATSSYGVTGALLYNFNEKWTGLLELGLGVTDFFVLDFMVGAEYALINANLFQLRGVLKAGYATGFGGSTTADILPGKTPPVILPEGTFDAGDAIDVTFNNIPVQLGVKPVIQLTERFALYGNFFYSVSLGNEATIEAGEVEVMFDSDAVVAPDGSSTQAGIAPELKLNGFGFDAGVIIRPK
ncbi:MAG: hypothetical protein R8G66_22125 [Cytophagales bacterium]|nr:hypothetical protein [Cytophagales bacterium]